MQRGVEIQHTVEREWVVRGREFASVGAVVTKLDETWRIWKVYLVIYLMVWVVFGGRNLARSRCDLGAIWGTISIRDRTEIATRLQASH